MGIRRTWRRLRALKAMGQAANEAAAQRSPAPDRGFAAGFANVMADALAQRMAAWAERSGGPLPASDAEVVDGMAWTQPVAIGADALRARDPAFDPALLESFARQVFVAVNAVWAGADASTVRPVLADALWEPLAAATGARGNANRPGPYGLGMLRATAWVTGLHAGPWYDSALVGMDVSIDFIGQARPSGMPPQMRAWDENWLFQRSARPGGDPMARPPICPSCGAPTRVDEDGLCRHCLVPVPFLTTGWLVSGIVSHHPSYALARERLAEQLRSNPEFAQRMSPEHRRLLPPGVTPDGFLDDEPPTWAP